MKLDYIIPEQNLDLLDKLIDRANKAATKLNLAQIKVEQHGVDHRDFLVNRKPQQVGEKSYWVPEDKFNEDRMTKVGPVRNWISVSIDGEQPKFSGWEFAATLMPVPTDEGVENEVRKTPGCELVIPKEFRDRAGECDHCNTNRRRNETYVVHSEKDGWKMVGSSCIKDFLGHSDPHAIAQYLSLIMDFGSVCGSDDDEFWGGKPEERTYDALSVLTQTSAVIRQIGWLSKGKAWNQGYGIPTVTNVLTCMNPPHRLNREDKEMLKKCEPTEADKERAEKVFKWMQEIDREIDNDYLANLSLLSRSLFVTYKSLGLLCSAVASYDREQAKLEKAKDYKDSKHIGEEKERLTLNVTVNRIFENENEFGVTRIHHMLTDDGNYLVWFATNNGLTEGEHYTVKATVKKHSVYNGVNQTIVNRVTPVKEKVKA